LLQTGTTSLADIEAVPELLAESLPATPLKVFSFLEMTGVKSGRSGTDIVSESLNVIEGLPSPYRTRAGLSPHSPYATHPDLLKATATAARGQRLLITSHVAESKPEWEMFMNRSGALFDWLRTQRRMEDCGDVTPVEHFDRQGLLNEGFLAAHANYLNDSDMDRLASRQVSVVHCPRSHQYFGHTPFPFRELRDRGVNLCLGTDSLASVRSEGRGLELSMFEEMRLFSTTRAEVDPEEVIRMATSNGAKALGHALDLGIIASGASADLVAIPFDGKPADAAAAVVNHRGRVRFSMIEGRCVYPTNTVD
jgi:cytosine/adenosine deaminase-related metal-dependent hydrolase